jgi:hypothetical protein
MKVDLHQQNVQISAAAPQIAISKTYETNATSYSEWSMIIYGCPLDEN